MENGGNESFNAVIVDARNKPIISMLEELRLYMIDKLFHSPLKGWSNDVSPAIGLKLNELKRDQRAWQVLPSGLEIFETRLANEAFEVDLEKRTCSCRLWQLNGYGCVHSVAAIFFLNREVEAYVDPMFKREKYLKTYYYSISPLNGSSMWPETSYTPPLPPIARRMPGRPKIKRKRDSVENVGRLRVSKTGRMMTCGLCAEQRHNKRCCPTAPGRSKLPVKRAKKRSKVISYNN